MTTSISRVTELFIGFRCATFFIEHLQNVCRYLHYTIWHLETSPKTQFKPFFGHLHIKKENLRQIFMKASAIYEMAGHPVYKTIFLHTTQYVRTTQIQELNNL